MITTTTTTTKKQTPLPKKIWYETKQNKTCARLRSSMSRLGWCPTIQHTLWLWAGTGGVNYVVTVAINKLPNGYTITEMWTKKVFSSHMSKQKKKKKRDGIQQKQKNHRIISEEISWHIWAPCSRKVLSKLMDHQTVIGIISPLNPVSGCPKMERTPDSCWPKAGWSCMRCWWFGISHRGGGAGKTWVSLCIGCIGWRGKNEGRGSCLREPGSFGKWGPLSNVKKKKQQTSSISLLKKTSVTFRPFDSPQYQ